MNGGPGVGVRGGTLPWLVMDGWHRFLFCSHHMLDFRFNVRPSI